MFRYVFIFAHKAVSGNLSVLTCNSLLHLVAFSVLSWLWPQYPYAVFRLLFWIVFNFNCGWGTLSSADMRLYPMRRTPWMFLNNYILLINIHCRAYRFLWISHSDHQACKDLFNQFLCSTCDMQYCTTVEMTPIEQPSSESMILCFTLQLWKLLGGVYSDVLVVPFRLNKRM